MAGFLLLFGTLCFLTPIAMIIISCKDISESGIIDVVSNFTLEQRMMIKKFMESGIVLFLAGLVMVFV
jgi:uncharacterized membrane protein HdeD (DUF308 family)